MTNLVLILHVVAGTIALFAGIVAMSSRKGTRTHRMAGTVFFVSMLVMAVFADYLAIAIPEQIPNLFIGTFTIYLVATAWLTVRRKERFVGIPEKIALLVILCLCVPFAILSFQLATGLAPSFKSATPSKALSAWRSTASRSSSLWRRLATAGYYWLVALRARDALGGISGVCV